ncbi:MAG TPA: IreB family regulatory phosphoprotein [Bacillota bacterium]|nr:IreB family regulatory phosphoprotein [Bacillota bacterium]
MVEPTEVTRRFAAKDENLSEVGAVLSGVCLALQEKGYDPLDQIVGYLLSGDPAYITSHRNARILIKSLNRDQILEELVSTYLKKLGIG